MELRPLELSDADALRDLFFRLSADTIYLRFFRPVRKPSEPFLRYLADVDHHGREAIAAVEDGKIIGVARFDRDAADPTRAEMAVLVEDAYQGHGIGTVLLEALAKRAGDEGVETFTASVLGGNTRMLSLAKHLAPDRRATIDHGEWLVEIPVGVHAA